MTGESSEFDRFEGSTRDPWRPLYGAIVACPGAFALWSHLGGGGPESLAVAASLLLGGLLLDQTTKMKDKVPFLGDMPYVGRLFRSESTSSKKTSLVIFVTPTIIDPAGNRVHSEEDLPFAQTTIPKQPQSITQ